MQDRLSGIRTELGGAELIAVSKTHAPARVREAYDAGQRHFGESYAQELRDKIPVLPADIQWHFLGRLQRNKLKYLKRTFRIHGLTHVDQAVGLAAKAEGLVGLINVNLAGEPAKAGVLPEDVASLAAAIHAVDGFELAGLMCIPPVGEDPSVHFRTLQELSAEQCARGLPLHELSMGMSGDWRIAVQHGATWVRIGTAIFGPRPT